MASTGSGRGLVKGGLTSEEMGELFFKVYGPKQEIFFLSEVIETRPSPSAHGNTQHREGTTRPTGRASACVPLRTDSHLALPAPESNIPG